MDSLLIDLHLFRIIINQTIHSPSIEHGVVGIRRGAMQGLIVLARPTLSQLSGVCVDAPVLHDSCNLPARILSFIVCTVKESKEGWAGSLAGKPESASVGAKVLVHLQSCGRRPVGVAAVGPGL